MPWTTQFNPSNHTLSTSINGVLTLAEIAAWRESLYLAASGAEASTAFRTLIDLRGYDVGEQDRNVHAAMREVTPAFLAAHGFTVGFWRLYETDPPAASSSLRCSAVAHVHHECYKMDRYNELLATNSERFFCDGDSAIQWLAAASA